MSKNMTWVWWDRNDVNFRLRFDHESDIHVADVWRMKPGDVAGRRGLYKANTSISKLERLHCPYVGNAKPVVVDDLWKSIILRFVSKERILFVPLSIRCRDGVSEKYWWACPHDRVRCIDPQRSNINSKIEKPDVTLIFGCDLYVHHENCLDGYHFALDEQMLSHHIISNDLRNALAETGEDTMFFRPEDLPLGITS